MYSLARTLIAGFILVSLTSQSSQADLQNTRNFYQFSDRLMTSGQPDEDALKSAPHDGIDVVINLVPPSEGIYNPKEAEILAVQGVEYIHIPVSWRSPDAADLETFLAAMDRIGDKKVLIHCWSNARASAFAYAHRVSQAPGTRVPEWKRLRTVWSEVAGYQLETDQVWQAFLNDNVASVD